jgi:hypothetical protein
MKPIGLILIFASVFVAVCGDTAEPVRSIVPPERLYRIADVLLIAADELIAAGNADVFEEYAVERVQRLFDENADDIDFPRPGVLTRPMARLAIRPVVKAVVRYADKKFSVDSCQLSVFSGQFSDSDN